VDRRGSSANELRVAAEVFEREREREREREKGEEVIAVGQSSLPALFRFQLEISRRASLERIVRELCDCT
jgi:hypothetical protein